MAEVKSLRLVKVANELNVGTHTIIEHLKKAGHEVEDKPTAKLTEDMYVLLLKEFQKDVAAKVNAGNITIGTQDHKDVVLTSTISAPKKEAEVDEVLIKSSATEATKERKAATPAKPKEEHVLEKADVPDLEGLKVVGKMDLSPPTPKPKQPEQPPVVQPIIE